MTAPGSGRYDGDSWDAASSVGATATMVAAARAMATRAENPLITDPYAEPLVRAVGIDMLTQLASGELDPSTVADLVDGARLADMATVRTKFYDEYFLAATQSGIRQVVILASGLDARAYRLSWPAGVALYEVDQPQVLAFKTKTLADIGASPSADRRTVPIDLRDDWITALRAAGFDPGSPTAWSAEGLLGYLPPEAQDRLLDTITESSASSSRLATESIFTPGTNNKERLDNISRQWQTHGFDPDMSNLVYFGDRHEPATYLAEHGWHVSSTTVHEMFAAHDLPPFDTDNAYIGNQRFLTATR